MVLTLMNGGDLRFHIHNIGSPGLAEERVVFYSAELASGLSHLHKARIAYRSVLFDSHSSQKLCMYEGELHSWWDGFLVHKFLA